MTTSIRRQPKVSSAALVGISLVILVGGLLPMVNLAGGPNGRLIWFNVAMLSDPIIPGRYKFLLLYPLFAGVFVMLLAFLAHGLTRTLLVIFAGVIPIFALVNDVGVREVFGNVGRVFVTAHGMALMVQWLGWTGIFVGAFSLLHCQASRNAATIAGLGGGFWLLSLVLPTGSEGETHLSVVQPVMTIITDPAAGVGAALAPPRWAVVLMGVAQIISMIFLTLSAAICIRMAIPRRTTGEGALLALIFLALSCLLSLFAGVFGTWAAFPNGALEPGAYMSLVLAWVKLMLWWFGLYMLIPIGLADLVLGYFSPMVEPKRAGSGIAVEEAPPVIP